MLALGGVRLLVGSYYSSNYLIVQDLGDVNGQGRSAGKAEPWLSAGGLSGGEWWGEGEGGMVTGNSSTAVIVQQSHHAPILITAPRPGLATTNNSRLGAGSCAPSSFLHAIAIAIAAPISLLLPESLISFPLLPSSPPPSPPTATAAGMPR